MKPLVNSLWLLNNLENKNVVILDCTIPKVTASKKDFTEKKKQIKGAIFFDIKNEFSDNKSAFPNTVLSPDEFEKKAQNIGINKDSIIICYDDIGIYSSPRVWWMFHLMGHKNVAVLNGGFPEWNAKQYPIENTVKKHIQKGNFKANFNKNKIKYTKDILASIHNSAILIVDARSKGRFLGTEPEPRKNIKSGSIPNSVNLPYAKVLNEHLFKPKSDIKKLFEHYTNHQKEIVFSCGTGITASILALAAAIININNFAVYDGSWTEWASKSNLPIEI